MGFEFTARQEIFGTSDLECMIGRGSRDVEQLASISGWRGLSGQKVTADVGCALNMLIHSHAANYGVELGAMRSWLPGLRNGALLVLGQDFDNWKFEGSTNDQNRFFAKLSGDRGEVKSFVARILGCCQHSARRQLRYHSPSDVEFLSDLEYERGHSGRAPRFVIDVNTLAGQLSSLRDVLFFGGFRDS